MRLWLLDITSIRFSLAPNGEFLSVLTSRREVLSAVQLAPGTSVEEAALLGYDSALGRGRIERVLPEVGRQSYGVALYDPFTAHVAVWPLPKTEVYSDRRALELDEDGCLVTLGEAGLWVGNRLLALQEADSVAITQAIAAYGG
jgi:hypothetical protein